MLAIILASDKTTLSVGTGNQALHPVYIGLGNIRAEYRNKDSYCAFLLLGLLPVAKFRGVRSALNTLLLGRVHHWCLDVCLKSLKDAVKEGTPLRDPLGNIRLCFPALAAYTVDLEEVLKLACVVQKRSPVTLATSSQLGDGIEHPRRHGCITLAQLQSAIDTCGEWTVWGNPGRFKSYCKSRFGLSGVHKPFWRDYLFANPTQFLTPDALHSWFKEFYTHGFRWLVKALTGEVTDRRYRLLQPMVGCREHFKGGVSNITQVTGKTYRNLHRYHLVVSDGLDPGFQAALSSLATFRLLAQLDISSTVALELMRRSLARFHHHKDAIVELGYRRARRMDIPKHELMLNVLYSIPKMGAAQQYSTETSKKMHVALKVAYRGSNRKDFEEQICRTLDRDERLRYFDLLCAFGESYRVALDDRETDLEPNPDIDQNHHWLAGLNTVQPLTGPRRPITDYFESATHSKHTFTTPTTAFHLISKFTTHSIEDAARLYHIEYDFYSALLDFFHSPIRSKRRPLRRVDDLDYRELEFSRIRIWPIYPGTNKIGSTTSVRQPVHSITGTTTRARGCLDLW